MNLPRSVVPHRRTHSGLQVAVYFVQVSRERVVPHHLYVGAIRPQDLEPVHKLNRYLQAIDQRHEGLFEARSLVQVRRDGRGWVCVY